MFQLPNPGGSKTIIGMIHTAPLPGTPFYEEDSFGRTLDKAVGAARALYEGGADGCLVQSLDRVYSVADESDPARTVAMGLIAAAIVAATDARFGVGVQLMRNALKASLAVAKVAGGSFVRAGAVVGMTLTEHGMVEAQPYAAMEYRRKISAAGIKIIAEVDSSHFRWFGGGKRSGEVAAAARMVGADAVSVGHPDEETLLAMVADVRQSVPGMPVFLAGHTNHANAARLLAAADGAFVGSCLESGPDGQISRELVARYVAVVRELER